MNIDRETLDRYEHLQEVVRCVIPHSEGKRHTDIGEDLGISRVRVTRAVDDAMEMGLAKIEIIPPNDEEVAEQLRDRYKLREAYVYPVGIEDEIMGILAHRSAVYIEDLLDDEEESISRIAVGPGRTMLALMGALSIKKRPDITVCSTTEAEHVETYLASNTIIGIPAWKWECKLERFVSGMTAARTEGYADLLVFGTGEIGDMKGVVPLSHLAYYNNVDRSELQSSLIALVEAGGAGIINYQHIGENGKLLSWDKALENTALKLRAIKRMAGNAEKRVVCVAGGADKVGAIRATLAGKYLNVLVTDYETAKALL